MERDILAELNPIFHPSSIAVVGASNESHKSGHMWLKGLKTVGFPGSLYPVNPKESEVLGIRAYTRVSDIPGPVDLVIVCIPRIFALSVLDDCAARGVKAVHFFTAGFRETGRDEDAALEESMLEKSRKGGFRIIGPNCIGIYHPEARIPWGPSDLISEPGSVGFISQSGGQAGKMLELGLSRGIRFSKVISSGNEIDLCSAELLEYLSADPKTKVIGAYLEGTGDGQHLLKAMKKAAGRKPVVIWKGGRTHAGAEVASSHTGSLIASSAIWSSAIKQAKAIEANGLEELADTLILLQQGKPLGGRSMGIVCGLADGGGGESVLAGDAFAAAGLDVPRFSPVLRSQLAGIFGEVGSVLRNPLDVSQGGSRTEKVKQALDLIAGEAGIDAIIIYENVDILQRFSSRDNVYKMNDVFIELKRRQIKPVIAVLPSGSADDLRLDIKKHLTAGDIAVFPSADRAAKAIANATLYWNQRSISS